MDALAAVMFLGMVFLISMSGALGPGPVLAATISKGYDDGRSGLKIATGHMLIEVPLIVGIYFGLETVLRNETLLLAIGLVGGAFLIYMGADMVRSDKVGYSNGRRAGASALTAGALTTAANPYFFLWWATVGATLITDAVEFGLIMLPIFAMVHLSVDYGWLQFVSFSVFRSKGLWSEKGHRILFIVSGAIMVIFGAYFLLSSLGSIL